MYPTSKADFGRGNRGLEISNGLARCRPSAPPHDSLCVDGKDMELTIARTQPGDWVRVIVVGESLALALVTCWADLTLVCALL